MAGLAVGEDEVLLEGTGFLTAERLTGARDAVERELTGREEFFGLELETDELDLFFRSVSHEKVKIEKVNMQIR